MATPPTSYGERPPLQGYRRSFTVPSRQLSLHERAGLDRSDADADILFSHPNARIIAFSPPTDSIQTPSKDTLPDADYPIDAVETLPWRSRTETLATSGLIRIEKVRGSSHFLKSADQKVIHTIMRNSQCWCVDGESKFVLRRGKFMYYRIELPIETEEDKQKVEEFKAALAKVLRFERTPCPFKRAFHVDLPDDAITPRRKGTWKRRQPPQPSTPNTDPLPLRKTKNSRAWSFQAQNEPSPLQTYGRRGSDYGYSASRGSSQTRPEANNYRCSTPSSVLSSEDAYDRDREGGSSEDGLQGEETNHSQQPDEASVNGSEPEERVDISGLESPDGPVATGEGDQPEEETDALPQPVEPRATKTPAMHDTDATALSIPPETEELDGTTAKEQIPQESLGGLENEVDGEGSLSPVKQLQQEVESSPDGPEQTSVAGAVEQHVKEDAASPPIEDEPEARLSDTKVLMIDDTGTETPSDTHAEETKSEPAEVITADHDDDALSRVSSVDSFYTTDSLSQDRLAEHVQATDFEKGEHAEGFAPFFLGRHQHQRGLSEMTITASTIASEQSPQKQRPSTSDSTPGLAHSSTSDSSWPEVHTPPVSPINENLRRRLQAKRSLSPLPPSIILHSPSTSPTSPNYGSPFTAQFLHKAANVALVKPIEAVVLLVHILARIAGGATLNDLFSGDLFRRPSEREEGVHRRRTSFPDQPAQPRDDSEEEEDDFGVPIRGRTKSVETTPAKAPRKKVEKDADADSIFDLD
ncbi:hypothetical protein A1O7_03964 [Cladophialophora yegresii CBS 114405]|uniref:Inheritance of peroxisomes protein 1 n=1 Tax=Cladophialophora yegresii CBS 114405 TaxID=1182544 RepID=W9VVK3_9EURO|nr:uncharacterized protein A1O7_03964 [Cladophialophora yegresii CBS 114405]EXJ59817.1 hypothetical protein A1O7_03964 [Cladophialophora yegresii CBS 114405]